MFEESNLGFVDARQASYHWAPRCQLIPSCGSVDLPIHLTIPNVSRWRAGLQHMNYTHTIAVWCQTFLLRAFTCCSARMTSPFYTTHLLIVLAHLNFSYHVWVYYRLSLSNELLPFLCGDFSTHSFWQSFPLNLFAQVGLSNPDGPQ